MSHMTGNGMALLLWQRPVVNVANGNGATVAKIKSRCMNSLFLIIIKEFAAAQPHRLQINKAKLQHKGMHPLL